MVQLGFADRAQRQGLSLCAACMCSAASPGAWSSWLPCSIRATRRGGANVERPSVLIARQGIDLLDQRPVSGQIDHCVVAETLDLGEVQVGSVSVRKAVTTRALRTSTIPTALTFLLQRWPISPECSHFRR